jgi:predicted dienelactone hydrolase
MPTRLAFILPILVFFPAALLPAYDPLALPPGNPPAPLELVAAAPGRNRDLPLALHLPAGSGAAPVVLFSHGLGGSRHGCSYLGRHWAARGYAVVFLQHPGSDDSVWQGESPARRVQAMRQAASVEQFLLRVRDVPVVLDRLADWNAAPDHPLRNRLDLSRVGMSGHSFGAITTQALSGQKPPAGTGFTDPRVRAAIAFSPSVPARGDAASAFGSVGIPWLLMTGTEDIARIGGQTIGAADVASRLGVFPALPPGGKYELVLHEGTHFAFTDRPDFGSEPARHPNHHRVILALGTAFWDAHLRGDAAARAWLDGEGPASLLAPGDRWQRK